MENTLSRIRQRTVLVGLATALMLAGCDRLPWMGGAGDGRTPVRITMAALHQAGGVPQGWRFTPPPGDAQSGRQLFADFGCYTCHVVQGEKFPLADRDESEVGPELTGMGSHHPAEYFAEAILNPNAVLVEGPGYIDEDGRSMMPAYPDMTIGELADLVAYLQSLRGGAHDPHAQHHLMASAPGCEPARPQPFSFIVQAEEVSNEELTAFDDWFAREGGQKLGTEQGVMSVDTYVNRAPERRVLLTVFGFGDDAGGAQFLKGMQVPAPAAPDGALQGYAGRVLYRSPVMYKTVGISLP